MGYAVRLPITDKQLPLLLLSEPTFETSHYFPHYGSDSHHKEHVEPKCANPQVSQLSSPVMECSATGHGMN
jgi:hypothetical protein